MILIILTELNNNVNGQFTLGLENWWKRQNLYFEWT